MKFEEWFDGRKIELERLYQGSVDGFNYEGFKNKCNLKDSLLFIAESHHGKKFGGYYSQKFDSN